MALIFHIASASEWSAATYTGEYRWSSRGRTLEDVGYIHCSTSEQVARVANLIYPGVRELVLLAVDVDRVQPEIRWERAEDLEEEFPHIYGPLAVAAIVAVVPFEPGPDGRFTFPGQLAAG